MGMNRDVYSYLLKTYGRQPKYWIGVILLIIQTVLLRVVTIFLISRLVAAIAAGDFDNARELVLWQLLAGIAGLLCRLGKDLLAYKAENLAYPKFLVAYYKKLVGKDMSFYRDHQAGYLASSFRQHGEAAMDLARMFRGELIQTPITLTIPAAIMFIASWKVGLAAAAVIIAQIIYVFWASAAVHKERAESHEIYRKISGVVSDDVTNIVAYKTSGGGRESLARMTQLTAREVQLFWLRHKKRVLLDAPRDIITMTGAAVAYWIIVNTSQNSVASVGLAVLTISYMFQIFQTVAQLPELITRHDDLVTRLYPTLEYLKDSNETIADPVNPQKLNSNDGRIDLENVSFSYPGSQGKSIQVFNGLNLHIPGGQQVGVVGLSGAGKSTLASLLMRFDDVNGGSIKIDGVDIRDVRQEDLRSQIAYVPQEPLLFHRTIRENLQYFGEGVTEKHMIQATKAAHAHEFITRLPDGYDSMVGERGVKLSGGQKQRVVIARAILKDAPIMLFDEATSALDSESEKIIQKALPQILGRRTAIVIAHRLSTIAGLDRIIVMENGKIIEDGTHDQLLKQKGRYYSLWQKQTNHENEESAALPLISNREGVLQDA